MATDEHREPLAGELVERLDIGSSAAAVLDSSEEEAVALIVERRLVGQPERAADPGGPRPGTTSALAATRGRRPGAVQGTSLLCEGCDRSAATTLAGVIASRLQTPVYRVNTDRVVSRYIGETEKNLAAVFELAEQTGAVLLFDEADALFGRRTAVKDSHDRDANVDVAHLLSLLSGFPGAVVIATASTADARLAAAVTAMVRRPRRR